MNGWCIGFFYINGIEFGQNGQGISYVHDGRVFWKLRCKFRLMMQTDGFHENRWQLPVGD